LRIKLCDFVARSNGFRDRISGIGFVEEQLALQIAGFNVVAINDSQAANPGPRQ
jgi:hypothetical protein